MRILSSLELRLTEKSYTIALTIRLDRCFCQIGTAPTSIQIFSVDVDPRGCGLCAHKSLGKLG